MIFNSEHPSRCGENATDEDVWEFLHQSHQQVRGKRFTLFDSTHNSRITPADAGKTILGLFIDLEFWDHPRGCGENELFGRRFS